MTINEAYAECLAITGSHYENFPVASVLVPAPLRRHIAAIYAFARAADDLADEGVLDQHARLSALDDFRRRLRTPDRDQAIDVALADTVARFSLPLDPFDRLLNAFVSDVGQVQFSSWQQVLDYCHNSANPVGELLLRLDNAPSAPLPEAIAASNDICTALQVTNFLQDVAIDRARGRTYLPLSQDETIARTYALYERGRAVAHHLRSWRLRWEIRLTMAGGLTMLDLCARRGRSDVRPTLGKRDLLRLLLRLFHVVSQKPLPYSGGGSFTT
jgi:phytoene/squalene synthetase